MDAELDEARAATAEWRIDSEMLRGTLNAIRVELGLPESMMVGAVPPPRTPGEVLAIRVRDTEMRRLKDEIASLHTQLDS
jgi:hypothetical protein